MKKQIDLYRPLMKVQQKIIIRGSRKTVINYCLLCAVTLPNKILKNHQHIQQNTDQPAQTQVTALSFISEGQ